MIPLALFALSGCLALSPTADHIRASDLAAVLPEWDALDAETPLLPAPIPGVQRVLRSAELRRLAVHWNIEPGAPRDVCFAIPVAAPDPERVLAAMQRQLPEARIEVLETSRQPAPEGDLEFPLAGLHLAPTGGYWNGYVSNGRHRFAIWARVKVAVSSRRVVAARDLLPGRVLEPQDLRLESRDDVPAAGSFLKDIAEAAGRIPRRPVSAGTALRPEWLDTTKEVQRGDTVQVEVIRGAAHLRLDGVALAGGAVGETIAIENPTSKRRFRARVEAKGRVVVAGNL